jgi:WD40 repeat protein
MPSLSLIFESPPCLGVYFSSFPRTEAFLHILIAEIQFVFCRGGCYIFTVTENSTTPLAKLENGHTSIIRDLYLSMDGSVAVTGGEDSKISFWSGQPVHNSPARTGRVRFKSMEFHLSVAFFRILMELYYRRPMELNSVKLTLIVLTNVHNQIKITRESYHMHLKSFSVSPHPGVKN